MSVPRHVPLRPAAKARAKYEADFPLLSGSAKGDLRLFIEDRKAEVGAEIQSAIGRRAHQTGAIEPSAGTEIRSVAAAGASRVVREFADAILHCQGRLGIHARLLREYTALVIADFRETVAGAGMFEASSAPQWQHDPIALEAARACETIVAERRRARDPWEYDFLSPDDSTIISWPTILLDWEAFRSELGFEPDAEYRITEYMLREFLSRGSATAPEDIAWAQMRAAASELCRHYGSVIVVPNPPAEPTREPIETSEFWSDAEKEFRARTGGDNREFVAAWFSEPDNWSFRLDRGTRKGVDRTARVFQSLARSAARGFGFFGEDAWADWLHVLRRYGYAKVVGTSSSGVPEDESGSVDATSCVPDYYMLRFTPHGDTGGARVRTSRVWDVVGEQVEDVFGVSADLCLELRSKAEAIEIALDETQAAYNRALGRKQAEFARQENLIAEARRFASMELSQVLHDVRVQNPSNEPEIESLLTKVRDLLVTRAYRDLGLKDKPEFTLSVEEFAAAIWAGGQSPLVNAARAEVERLLPASTLRRPSDAPKGQAAEKTVMSKPPMLSANVERARAIQWSQALKKRDLTGKHLQWHRKRDRLGAVMLQPTKRPWQQVGVSPSVVVADLNFKILAQAYFELWDASGEQYDVFTHWLIAAEQTAIQDLRSVWKGHDAGIDSWFDKVCEPEARRSLRTLRGEWTQKAQDRELSRLNRVSKMAGWGNAMPASPTSDTPGAKPMSIPELPPKLQRAFEVASAKADLDHIEDSTAFPHAPAVALLSEHVWIQKMFFAYCSEVRNACEAGLWTLGKVRSAIFSAWPGIFDSCFDQRYPSCPEHKKTECRDALWKTVLDDERWKRHIKDLAALAELASDDDETGKTQNRHENRSDAVEQEDPLQDPESELAPADVVAAERIGLINRFKAAGRSKNIRATDEMIAKAANGRWNDRTMVTWWKRNDTRCESRHDKMIRAVLAKDPSSLWEPNLKAKRKRL